jgi:hypothetical protein
VGKGNSKKKKKKVWNDVFQEMIQEMNGSKMVPRESVVPRIGRGSQKLDMVPRNGVVP